MGSDALSGTVVAIPTDITDEASANVFTSGTREQFGGHIVNVASVARQHRGGRVSCARDLRVS